MTESVYKPISKRTPPSNKWTNAHPLTDMQKAFIKYYTQGLQPKEAAIKAGYNPRDAHKRANEILKKPACKGIVKIGLQRLAETEQRQVASDLKATLNVLDKVIEAGTTPEKLETLATPSHALTATDIKAKILSFYAPEKSVNINVDVDIAEGQRLTEMIKEKEKGF